MSGKRPKAPKVGKEWPRPAPGAGQTPCPPPAVAWLLPASHHTKGRPALACTAPLLTHWPSPGSSPTPAVPPERSAHGAWGGGCCASAGLPCCFSQGNSHGPCSLQGHSQVGTGLHAGSPAPLPAQAPLQGPPPAAAEPRASLWRRQTSHVRHCYKTPQVPQGASMAHDCYRPAPSPKGVRTGPSEQQRSLPFKQWEPLCTLEKAGGRIVGPGSLSNAPPNSSLNGSGMAHQTHFWGTAQDRFSGDLGCLLRETRQSPLLSPSVLPPAASHCHAPLLWGRTFAS